MKNIRQEQSTLLAELKRRSPELRLRWSEERGAAHTLTGSILPWARIRDPAAIIRETMRSVGPLVGPVDAQGGFREVSVRKDRRGGFRAKAAQIVKGLPVYSATVLVFADRKRGVHRVQSSFWRDVDVTAMQRLKQGDLRRRLEERLMKADEARRFVRAWRGFDASEWERANFPLTSAPTLYLHVTDNGFHPAFHVMAWQQTEWIGVAGQRKPLIDRSELMVDAATGNILWEEPAREGMAWTDVTCDGLSTLVDSAGNHLLRTLQAVREGSSDYYLVNRDHTPEISTYDAGGTDSGLVGKLKGISDLSADADGHWNTTTTSCSAADRRDSQQPETDCHFNAERAWQYYHALGWDGFDDGSYGDASPVKLAAHIGMDMNAYFSKYSETVPGPTPGTTINKWYGYLAFYDGLCDGSSRVMDFMAGDPVIFGHEYQHAITFFGAAKANDEPGHLYGNSWLGGIREGYSDAFGCLRTGMWRSPELWPDGVLHGGANFSYSGYTLERAPFRRVEFPRSTDTVDGTWYCDHYDDRGVNQTGPFFGRKYFVSTLLSHLAFLVAEGGLHQRAGRAPELIPISGVGRERVAEIFLLALTSYFETIPTNLSGPTLVEAGNLLLDAAEEVSGSDRSCEYVMMRRALYALGLCPRDESYNTTTYGGEAVMLPWGYSWRRSQPYVGLPALWWKSLDLFVNNGSSAAFDAVVGQENKLFARVRNIGDDSLSDVMVRFYFSPKGTNLPSGVAGWHACKDSDGNDCVLTIPSLGAGATNIADVDSPPADQAVKWYLDPAYVSPEVDHFCVRAEIECATANHDNDCVYRVQSNVKHVQPSDADGWTIGFFVANRGRKEAPVQLEIKHTLPRGYILKARYPERMRKHLEPGEERALVWDVRGPRRRPTTLAAPYDGEVNATIDGVVSGRFTGQLSEVTARVRGLPGLGVDLPRQVHLRGRLAGVIKLRNGLASVNGWFAGALEPASAALRGRLEGVLTSPDGKTRAVAKLEVKGCLKPARTVEFTQRLHGEAVGGVTVSIELPRIPGQLLPDWHR